MIDTDTYHVFFFQSDVYSETKGLNTPFTLDTNNNTVISCVFQDFVL